MTIPGLDRIRAAIAALRGRIVVPASIPTRPVPAAMPDIAAAMARVEEMRATMAEATKKMDEMAALIRANAAKMRVDQLRTD